jgi:hypothetical protein
VCRTLACALPGMLVAQGDLVGLGDVVGLDGPQSRAQALAGLPQQLEGVGEGARLVSYLVRLSDTLLIAMFLVSSGAVMKSDEAFQADPLMALLAQWRQDPLMALLARWRQSVVIDALKNRPDVVEVIPSGSLARGTPLGPVHDVDLIVIFDQEMHRDWQSSGSARAALEQMQTAIREALEARPGQPLGPVPYTELRNHVVVAKLELPHTPLGALFPDAPPVDVMPAIRHGSHLRVPELSSDTWIDVDLERLMGTLAAQQRAWSNFDEAVRMIKGWAHHQGLQIPSLAVEMLVMEYLPRPALSELMLSSDAIAGFFETASRARITRMPDPAGRYGEIAPGLNYAALQAALSKSAALARQAVDAERAWPTRDNSQEVVTHPSRFWQEIFGQNEFRRPQVWYWNLESPADQPSPQSRRWFDEHAEPFSLQSEDPRGPHGSRGFGSLEPDDPDRFTTVADEIAETDDEPSPGEASDAAEGLDPRIVERLVAGDGEAATALARRGESQWVELKERLPEDRELAKDLAALANSGGGVLIVGVADNGEVTGWRPADADIAVRRMREIANHILPDLAHIGRGQVEEGWFAWAIAESADEPVVTAEGTYWRRASNRVQRAELPAQGLIVRDPSASSASLPEEGPVRVYVAMSFREEEEPALVDYWQAMLRAAKQAHREFKLIRLDEVEGDYDIVGRIYKEIDAAHMVIADLTLSPPNVYLEIGYARGREKQVIQTCRYDTQLEFDVRGRRTLTYRNATTLEHKLLRELDVL